MTLTGVEESFRCLKSELGLRPVYHQKDNRMAGHLFISVLAYHLLVSIRKALLKKGISRRWDTVRELMSTHMLATTAGTNREGRRVYQRRIGDPEPFHLFITFVEHLAQAREQRYVPNLCYLYNTIYELKPRKQGHCTSEKNLLCTTS